MSSDPSSIESDLCRLRASSLDESLLARLEACAEDSWTKLSPNEAAFEHELQSHAPSALSPALMASLLDQVSAVPFPGEQNIVRFPAASAASTTASEARRQRGWWSAAAAVAIAGALSALMVPTGTSSNKTAANKTPQANTPPTHNTGSSLVPAGFNRGLADASDEGVIWQKDSRPHRVLRVVYQDRVTLKDANGHLYQVEQPRVEYILVPAKTD
ncbi:MAG: hypothetical protein MUF13_12455 [Akkermansiaceae bacterium]|jgi:hypothetical protein|nr:hypothetical protein [Akkermansiaceae bacterium]